jgi:hypothetical protein
MSLSSVDPLRGWIPIYVSFYEESANVYLAHSGDIRFTSPFFVEDVQRILRKPFNTLFRKRISLEDLAPIVESSPDIRPSGFIFHLSRCGSTLISQELASSTKNIVLSEAEPIDSVLSARLYHPWVTEGMQVGWLRSIVGKLLQPRFGESRGFIKFDSWHTFYLPLIARAFPDVPLIFVYRNPVEIIASQIRRRGIQTIPGGKVGLILGLTLEAAMSLSPEEYCATILARTCDAFLGQYEALSSERRIELVNYTQLPHYSWERLPDVFNFERIDNELQLMRDVASRDAKDPMWEFKPDSVKKQRESTESMRAAANSIMRPYYERLEQMRMSAKS